MSRSFDGVDDRLTTSGSVLNPAGSTFTISLWYMANINNATKYFFNINDGSAVRSWSLIATNVGGFQVQIADSTQTGANFLLRRSASGVTTNVWTNLTVTGTGVFTDATSVKIYKNFSEVTYDLTQNGIGTEATHSGTWTLGGRTQDNTVNFNGNLAFSQFFNRVLSNGEIRQCAYYPGSIIKGLKWFIPAFGSTPELDYTINKNNAVVTGALISKNNPPTNRVFGFNSKKYLGYPSRLNYINSKLSIVNDSTKISILDKTKSNILSWL